MLPTFELLLEWLSAEDREIAKKHRFIMNAPQHWQIVVATNEKPTGFSEGSRGIKFTFSPVDSSSRRLTQGPREFAQVIMSGKPSALAQDGLKLVLRLEGSCSLFVYVYDLRLRRGELIDVNFLRWGHYLQAGHTL